MFAPIDRAKRITTKLMGQSLKKIRSTTNMAGSSATSILGAQLVKLSWRKSFAAA
jgi:hypothetical protein